MAAGKTPKKTAPPFAKRRSRLEASLRREAGKRPALALVFSGVEPHLAPFRLDPDFFYLTGAESPGSALLLGVNLEKPLQVLLLPAPDPASERWTGRVLTSGGYTPEVEPDALRKEAMDRTGFELVESFHKLEEVLVRPLRAAGVLYLSLPRDAVSGPIEPVQLFAENLRRRLPALEIRNLSPLTAALRRGKDASELDLMRRAAAATDAAHEAVLAHLAPGMAEYEVQALVEYVFRIRGAEELAFPSIIASGPNSCCLHYGRNRRRMEKGDLVVCDIGARLGHYCADLTRTYPVSGRFTRRQRQVYEVVLEAQEAGIRAVKPGVRIRDVHQAASAVIEKAGFGRYFFHGTSHFLGIEAHDAGDADEPLKPGDVITVEPGIYIASESCGVRIEDDVAVTARGREVLSSAPKDPGELERLLSRKRKAVAL